MSMGLFDEDEHPAIEEPSRGAPLADRLRPRTPEEFAGQRHLLGEGNVLDRALRGAISQSLILWGPPGVGKTTLARLIASASGMRFVPFSAVLSGIKEVRTVMAEARERLARTGRRTLLFVDEIHRFNKAQQDAFLPFVERGDILLIGATTENPSFELNSALLSRARTIILEPLSADELIGLLRRALEDERGLGGRIRASDASLRALAYASDGDARRSLNVLETVAALLPSGGELDEHVLAQALQRKVLHYDKSGEEHFNLISALHKSVRNSDETATVYWVTRMLHAGEDGKYVSRRLVRMAVEDIGLADPAALGTTLQAADAYHRLGSPEGDLALVQAAVALARAKKSNDVYLAHGRALEDVENTAAEPVPLHLRNATTGLMKAAGYGKGYRYVHDDPAARDEMSCMPPSLVGRDYFARSESARPAGSGPQDRDDGLDGPLEDDGPGDGSEPR